MEQAKYPCTDHYSSVNALTCMGHVHATHRSYVIPRDSHVLSKVRQMLDNKSWKQI